jgi:hypothetical protein
MQNGDFCGFHPPLDAGQRDLSTGSNAVNKHAYRFLRLILAV